MWPLPLEQYTTLNRVQIYKLVSLKLALVGLGGFEEFYPSEISARYAKTGRRGTSHGPGSRHPFFR